MRKVRATLGRTPVLEVIACSVADAIEAERGGAARIEIIRDFHKGGLTPPIEMVQGILDAVTIPVRVMLRENESYEANEADIDKLCSAAGMLAELPVDGVVLGFLRQQEVNVEVTERILAGAPNLKATFHHAFEEAHDQLEAIRALKQIGQIDRILAHGGPGKWAEKIERLAGYADAARPEIEILAGGGIDQETLETISRATSIREFHVGRAVREPATAAGVVSSHLVRALVQTSVWQGCEYFYDR